MDSFNSDQWVDTATLAERLSLSEIVLKKWRGAGEGPPYAKIGASVRYRWGSVMEWLEQRTIGAVSGAR